MRMLHPNQKAIRIHKKDLKKGDFSSINLTAMKEAMNALSPNTFKIWLWLDTNAEGYTLALSGVVLQQDCGFSSATYTKGVRELIDKGYLDKVELYQGLEGYLFWEGGKSQMEEEKDNPSVNHFKVIKEQRISPERNRTVSFDTAAQGEEEIRS